jgi:hypothetical protein
MPKLSDNSLPQAINLSNHPGGTLTTPLQNIQVAVQTLYDEIAQLREERDRDRQEIASLHAKLTSLDSLQEQDINRICLDIALDRKRIAKLENPQKGPGKTELSRAEKIERYLASRPDHKASYETLKGFLEIDDVKLNLGIAALMREHPGEYARQNDKVDGRKRWLVLIPKIV